MTKKEFFDHAKEGVVKGMFWAIGVSIGFAIVTAFLIFMFSQAEAVPLLGDAIATIVKATLQSLGAGVSGE